MDLNNLTGPLKAVIEQTIGAIRFIAETAENLRDFRDQLARLALEGDLDDTYEHLRHAEDRRAKFIETGE